MADKKKPVLGDDDYVVPFDADYERWTRSLDRAVKAKAERKKNFKIEILTRIVTFEGGGVGMSIAPVAVVDENSSADVEPDLWGKKKNGKKNTKKTNRRGK